MLDSRFPYSSILKSEPYLSSPYQYASSLSFHYIFWKVLQFIEFLNKIEPSSLRSQSRGGLIIKSLMLILLTSSLYCYTLSYFYQNLSLSPLIPISLSALIGLLFAIHGLSIQHDANHGSFSRSFLINSLFGFVDDMIGGSSLLWRHQHMLAHHLYPNDIEWDSDTFSNYPLFRFNPNTPIKPMHKYQFLYVFPLLSLIGIDYSLRDFLAFSNQKYVHISLHPLRFLDRFVFYLGKFLHFSIVLFIPIYYLSSFYYAFLFFYLPLELMGGFFLAALFAVSHNNTKCLFNMEKINNPSLSTNVRASSSKSNISSIYPIDADSPSESTTEPKFDSQLTHRSVNKDVSFPTNSSLSSPSILTTSSLSTPSPTCWAQSQILTSANWGTNNPFWLLISGGLNYQIEHHLFPSISHIHYPLISQITKQTCQEFNIPYNEYPTFRAIFLDFIRHLYRMGRN
jgi:fatty acid desaturase